MSSSNVWTSSGESDYNALQIELRRRLSRGFQINGSYQYALAKPSSNFVSQRYGYVSNPTANVRHAIKFQWDWSMPVGRGRRFGSDLDPLLDAVVGGWEFNGAGRVQARTLNFGNVRLVGMTLDELHEGVLLPHQRGSDQRGPRDRHDAARRHHPEHAPGVQRQRDVGQRLLGSRRARGPLHRAGQQRSCIQLKGGDCAPRTLLIRAPWFTRVDVSLAKKFQAQRR